MDAKNRVKWRHTLVRQSSAMVLTQLTRCLKVTSGEAACGQQQRGSREVCAIDLGPGTLYVHLDDVGER